MKKAILLLALFSVIGCSKEKSTPIYHLPTLEATTWRAYSFTGPSTGTKYYDYLHFTTNNSVDLYTSDILNKDIDIGESGSGGISTCNYTVSKQSTTSDTFQITFKNGTNASGVASDNQNVIIYQGTNFVKVE